MRSKELSASEEANRDLFHHVIDFLHQRDDELHRSLIIRVESGVVAVEGRLPSCHLRQIAVECIMRATGVTRVVDRIVVDRTN